MSGSLFAGWMPDAGARERLAGLVSALRAAAPPEPALKPRRPDQWHVTLCFIDRGGDAALATAAARALAPVAARIPPHRFHLERLAYWAGPGVIVALPAPNAALQALCEACSAALRRAGVGPLQDTRQPHITLAYTERRLAPQPWLERIDCTGAALRVDRFQLLSNPGGRYEAHGDWPLLGTALPPAPGQARLF